MTRTIQTFKRLVFLFVSVLIVYNGAPTTPVPTDASAPHGEVDRYGDWFVGCNNLGLCTTVTATNQRTTPPATSAHIVIEFRGDSDDKVVAQLHPAVKPSIVLPATTTQRLLADLTRSNQDTAIVHDTDGRPYGFTAAGFSEAVSALRTWRMGYGRRNLVSKPILATPVQRLENVGTPAVLRRIKRRCPAGQMELNPFQAWKQSDGTIIWRAGCDDESINPTSFWFWSASLRAPKTLIRFSNGQKGFVPAYNSWLDINTGLVRITHSFGHFEDCGVRRLYSWQNGAMELFEERVMPICGTDLQQENWISVYSAGSIVVGPKVP
jgi:hypothetical protein